MARKILFVTHDTSIYGASKSLQALIHFLKGQAECGLVVRQDFRRAIDFAGLRAQFGVDKVYATWLPFLDCFVGRADPVPLRGRLWLLLSNLLGHIGRRRIAALAKREGYDVVHLNSLVLASLVTDEVPTVVHVRELWDGRYRALVRKRLESAAGVVFIDEPVAVPFQGFALKRSLVLANPVLPGAVAPLPREKARIAERIAGKLVLAIVGRVTEEKGAAFLIQCLKDFADPRIALLIVGEGEMQSACEAYARQDPRLIYYGSENDMDIIYTAADVVIRAEDSPRVGRTVYEALYAGRSVALPGAPSAYPAELVETHRGRMYFYDVRNVPSFTMLLGRLLDQRPVRGEPVHMTYDTGPLRRFWERSMADGNEAQSVHIDSC